MEPHRQVPEGKFEILDVDRGARGLVGGTAKGSVRRTNAWRLDFGRGCFGNGSHDRGLELGLVVCDNRLAMTWRRQERQDLPRRPRWDVACTEEGR